MANAYLLAHYIEKSLDYLRRRLRSRDKVVILWMGRTIYLVILLDWWDRSVLAIALCHVGQS